MGTHRIFSFGGVAVADRFGDHLMMSPSCFCSERGEHRPEAGIAGDFHDLFDQVEGQRVMAGNRYRAVEFNVDFQIEDQGVRARVSSLYRLDFGFGAANGGEPRNLRLQRKADFPAFGRARHMGNARFCRQPLRLADTPATAGKFGRGPQQPECLAQDITVDAELIRQNPLRWKLSFGCRDVPDLLREGFYCLTSLSCHRSFGFLSQFLSLGTLTDCADRIITVEPTSSTTSNV
ncbi:hypothetical protein NOJ17_28455 [Neorhizobium galegae]|nr:hypothetical protein [Neorhizobium galegae]MCQ1838823.1 hypothetical protein [Neorhizobium galegae]